MTALQHNLALYITGAHDCGYYDDRQSVNLIPDPQIPMNPHLYSLLVSKGFRRSGDFVYRPHCETCQRCLPCRIDSRTFKPNRNQRRSLKRNHDLTTRLVPARYTDEYFELYQRYINRRHGDGSMADPSPEEFQRFLLCEWNDAIFIESRLGGRLLCLAVVDCLQDGYSAVYSFFDPDETQRSLGTFAILQQIWLAQLYQRPYVYLGYWIDQHPKMDYKKNFHSLQLFRQEQWLPFTTI